MASATHEFRTGDGGLPAVRVGVRHGKAAPAFTEMSRDEFLIGAAPGCELRLPGATLPPVVCIIARRPGGVGLRRIAQNTPLLLNGLPVPPGGAPELNEGDTITVGRTDILLNIDTSAIPPGALSPKAGVPVEFRPPAITNPAPPQVSDAEWERRETEFRHRYDELVKREAQAGEAHRELENDRVLWYRRRGEMEKEQARSREELAGDILKKHEIDRHYAAFEKRHVELAEWRDQLDTRQRELERANLEREQREHDFREREKALSADWEGRRQLLEAEWKERGAAQEAAFAQGRAEWEERQRALESEFARRRADLAAELLAERERAEREWRIWIEQKDTGYVQLRAQIEAEIHDRYRRRGEELDRFQLTVREAAIQLREHRNAHDELVRQFEPRWAELQRREGEVGRDAAELAEKAAAWTAYRDAAEKEQAGWRDRVRERDDELTAWEERLKDREAGLERGSAERGAEQARQQAKLQAGLAKLAEAHIELAEKERQLAERAAEIDARWEGIRDDVGNFEEQARELDERRGHLALEEQEVKKAAAALREREAALDQRLPQLEMQQATLAGLRMQVERERDEIRREAARSAAERERAEAALAEARDNLRAAEGLRESLAEQDRIVGDGRKAFDERSEMLRQAMGQLRALQDRLSAQDGDLSRREEELAKAQAALAEEAAVCRARLDRAVDLQRKLDEDRAALRQREADLALADEPRRTLQEQIRKRSEQLANQQAELDARATQLDGQTKLLQRQADELEALRADAITAQQQSAEVLAATAAKDAELARRGEELERARAALAARDAELSAARELLAGDRRLTAEQTDEEMRKLSAFRDEIAAEAEAIRAAVPEAESRLQSSLDRSAQVRDQLRGQLAEFHTYARQSQEELQAVRDRLSAEVEKLRQQDAELNRGRTEHRHAVASFKQQLLEWQTRFADLRHVVAANQSTAAKKQAHIEVTALELAHRSEVLEAERQRVAGQRGEIERHLKEMRQWYRAKLRELVDGSRPAREGADDERNILPLHSPEAAKPVRPEELDAGDRALGETLRAGELVDAETLNALWNGAKAARKPLRQALLSSNALTVYQMSLIEAGNLNGLVLGRFRVIDRLPGSSREALFKVYDPQALADERRGAEGHEGICLLRHLAESEMSDAVRPDEYRERFRAARDLAHPNIRGTREVLEIAGRPAAVQEWPLGLSSDEWPATAAAPGVWFRLVSQAGLALYTAAQAGLHHGRLTAESFRLTREGLLKVDGFGEPAWLFGSDREPNAADDLLALGRVVVGWADLNRRRKKFPDPLQQVLRRLGADGTTRDLYASPTELLDDLDRAGGAVPINGDAWDKLLDAIGESPLRQSA